MWREWLSPDGNLAAIQRLWKSGMNTAEIARNLRVKESFVYNNLETARRGVIDVREAR